MIKLLPSILLAAALAAGASAQPPAPGGERPRGGPMGAGLFLSPMGEPFRAATAEESATAWFAGADANKDGVLTIDEMAADGDRFFALLDVDADGRLSGEEQTRYETEIAPMVRSFGGGGGARRDGRGNSRRVGGGEGGKIGEGRVPGGDRPPSQSYDAMRQGAGRFGYLNIPEPVSSADTSLNFIVTQQEFRDAARARFRLLDADHDGKIAPAELPPLPSFQRRR